MNNLNVSLSDSNAAIAELQERIQQLQRALTSSEHDRRVMQERLDTTRLDQMCGKIKIVNVMHQFYADQLNLTIV